MFNNELQDIAKEALDQANEQSAQILYNDIKATEDEVKLSAAQLVNYAEYLKNKWYNSTYVLQSIKKDEDPINKVFQFQKKMVQTTQEFKILMSYVFDLQNKINSFLGQQIQMVYTFIKSDGTVEVYKFNNDIEHLKISRASSSRGGNITGRIRFTAKERKNLEKFIPNYNPASLDSTFQEVYNRYLISKLKTKGKLYGSFYIFWNTGNGWEGSKITGVGALGESYFNFFINEYTFSSFMEEAVKDFITNNKYGVEVGDSTSGFLQGDVTKGIFEYGVKSTGASALGYSDIIQYAYEIQSADNLMSYLIGIDGKGGLKQALIDESEKNLAQRVLQNEMDNVIIQDIIEELKKNNKGNINIQFS